MGEPGGRHLPPFYCPYCGEERIRPAGEQAGEWACELCRRVWRLRLVGGTEAAGADGDGSAEVGPSARR
ncbi:MAG TPA: hypothetical protein VFX70_18565 [Mycobacteriales bacterium]|nr:hypothetical protein [Mycobacteriales bacterium]